MKFSIGSVEVDIGPSRAGFISIFNKKWADRTYTGWAAMHFFVWPHKDVVYKRKGKGEIEVEGYWVWGRATEQYDHCAEYFGLGPLFLMCW
jgi:hypothetical protein